MPSLISTDFPKKHGESHVSPDEHSQPCFRGRQSVSSSDILFRGYSVYLSITLLKHTHCLSTLTLLTRAWLHVRLSQPSFIPYIQPQRADAVCGSVLYIWIALRRHVEFSRSFWSGNSAASACDHLHELTTNNPELYWSIKDFKVAGSWVTWHILFWDSVLVPVEALAFFLIRAEVHI